MNNNEVNYNKKLPNNFMKWIIDGLNIIFNRPIFWFTLTSVFIFLFHFLQSSLFVFVIPSIFFCVVIHLMHNQKNSDKIKLDQNNFDRYLAFIVIISFLSTIFNALFVSLIKQYNIFIDENTWKVADYFNPILFISSQSTSIFDLDWDLLFFNVFNTPFYYLITIQLTIVSFGLLMFFALFIWFKKSIYFSFLHNILIIKNNLYNVLFLFIFLLLISFIIDKIHYIVFPFFYVYSIAVIYSMWADLFDLKNKEKIDDAILELNNTNTNDDEQIIIKSKNLKN